MSAQSALASVDGHGRVSVLHVRAKGKLWSHMRVRYHAIDHVDNV